MEDIQIVATEQTQDPIKLNKISMFEMVKNKNIDGNTFLYMIKNFNVY